MSVCTMFSSSLSKRGEMMESALCLKLGEIANGTRIQRGTQRGGNETPGRTNRHLWEGITVLYIGSPVRGSCRLEPSLVSSTLLALHLPVRGQNSAPRARGPYPPHYFPVAGSGMRNPFSRLDHQTLVEDLGVSFSCPGDCDVG